MSKSESQFIFMTCRVGAEAALKQEVARAMPAWRVAYSRPGFVTFKCADGKTLGDKELAQLHWTFAHSVGISLGKLLGAELAPMAQEVWRLAVDIMPTDDKAAIDLHVWQREPVLDEDGEGTFGTPLSLEIEAAIRTAAPESVHIEREAPAPRRASLRNSLVLDVVLVEPGEWWVGYHRAVRRNERWPGGVIPVRLPPHAVSRAYAKLEEALQWSDLPLAGEDECVEVGCAGRGESGAARSRAVCYRDRSGGC